MKIMEQEEPGLLEHPALGRLLRTRERKDGTFFACRFGRTMALEECRVFRRHGKILTTEQRELMKQHKAWLDQSYEIEKMDQARESWL